MRQETQSQEPCKYYHISLVDCCKQIVPLTNKNLSSKNHQHLIVSDALSMPFSKRLPQFPVVFKKDAQRARTHATLWSILRRGTVPSLSNQPSPYAPTRPLLKCWFTLKRKPKRLLLATTIALPHQSFPSSCPLESSKVRARRRIGSC